MWKILIVCGSRTRSLKPEPRVVWFIEENFILPILACSELYSAWEAYAKRSTPQEGSWKKIPQKKHVVSHMYEDSCTRNNCGIKCWASAPQDLNTRPRPR